MDLDFEVLDSEGSPQATVIWLHGIGQEPSVLVPLARRMELPAARVRSVFPSAPEQSVPLARQKPAKAWFRQQIFRLDDPETAGLERTESALRELLAAESERVGADRVMLAGFSQGAAMALVTGLRYPQRLAGIALYAPYLVRAARIEETRGVANADVPIWIGHGRRDWIIPYFLGEGVRDLLNELGHDVSWHRYRGGHEPFGEAAEDLRRFVDRAVDKPAARQPD